MNDSSFEYCSGGCGSAEKDGVKFWAWTFGDEVVRLCSECQRQFAFCFVGPGTLRSDALTLLADAEHEMEHK